MSIPPINGWVVVQLLNILLSVWQFSENIFRRTIPKEVPRRFPVFFVWGGGSFQICHKCGSERNFGEVCGESDLLRFAQMRQEYGSESGFFTWSVTLSEGLLKGEEMKGSYFQCTPRVSGNYFFLKTH